MQASVTRLGKLTPQAVLEQLQLMQPQQPPSRSTEPRQAWGHSPPQTNLAARSYEQQSPAAVGVTPLYGSSAEAHPRAIAQGGAMAAAAAMPAAAAGAAEITIQALAANNGHGMERGGAGGSSVGSHAPTTCARAADSFHRTMLQTSQLQQRNLQQLISKRLREVGACSPERRRRGGGSPLRSPSRMPRQTVSESAPPTAANAASRDDIFERLSKPKVPAAMAHDGTPMWDQSTHVPKPRSQAEESCEVDVKRKVVTEEDTARWLARQQERDEERQRRLEQVREEQERAHAGDRSQFLNSADLAAQNAKVGGGGGTFFERMHKQQLAAEQKYSQLDQQVNGFSFKPTLSSGTRRLADAEADSAPFLERVVKNMKEAEEKDEQRRRSAETMFSFVPSINSYSNELAKAKLDSPFEERMQRDIRQRRAAAAAARRDGGLDDPDQDEQEGEEQEFC